MYGFGRALADPPSFQSCRVGHSDIICERRYTIPQYHACVRDSGDPGRERGRVEGTAPPPFGHPMHTHAYAHRHKNTVASHAVPSLAPLRGVRHCGCSRAGSNRRGRLWECTSCVSVFLVCRPASLMSEYSRKSASVDGSNASSTTTPVARTAVHCVRTRRGARRRWDRQSAE